MIACPTCGRPMPGEVTKAGRDERLKHAPMAELDLEELLEARRLGYVSEPMLRAEQRRRGVRL